MEKDKRIYHCKTKCFNEDTFSRYNSLEDYIEEVYNDKQIEIVDLKIVYEEMHLDKPSRYRVFVIYRNV